MVVKIAKLDTDPIYNKKSSRSKIRNAFVQIYGIGTDELANHKSIEE